MKFSKTPPTEPGIYAIRQFPSHCHWVKEFGAEDFPIRYEGGVYEFSERLYPLSEIAQEIYADGFSDGAHCYEECPKGVERYTLSSYSASLTKSKYDS